MGNNRKHESKLIISKDLLLFYDLMGKLIILLAVIPKGIP